MIVGQLTVIVEVLVLIIIKIKMIIKMIILNNDNDGNNTVILEKESMWMDDGAGSVLLLVFGGYWVLVGFQGCIILLVCECRLLSAFGVFAKSSQNYENICFGDFI